LKQRGFGLRSRNDEVGEFEDVDDFDRMIFQPFDCDGAGLIVEAFEQYASWKWYRSR
jgi:hypothetical protein